MDGTTIGVEEEFQIIDLETGGLAPRSHELVPLAKEALGVRVGGELNRCQIEVDTPICECLDEVDVALRRLRIDLDEVAAELGCGILPVAAHPWSHWQDQEVEQGRARYRDMEDRYQVVARQQVICGCHVHVGVADRDLAVTTMAAARPWLPILLALSANSPFWEGQDTGYDSYRLEIWERWPTAGMPPDVADAEEYDDTVDRLRRSGAIADDGELYWYVRPSARYPTLEVRAADVCLTVDDTVAIAGLARALVVTSLCRLDQASPVPTAVLDGAMWRAARYGLGEDLVSARSDRPVPAAQAVEELLDHTGRALDAHGDGDRVRSAVQRILAEGNGAHRQREVLRATGDLRAVVVSARGDGLAREPVDGEREHQSGTAT